MKKSMNKSRNKLQSVRRAQAARLRQSRMIGTSV
jgi:hypothetical protein